MIPETSVPREVACPPTDEPLPPAAPPWLLATTALLLFGSAIGHVALIRAGFALTTTPRLAVSVLQVLLIGLAYMQIGWRRPFAAFLWTLFVLFLASLAVIIATDVAAHAGPPLWAR